MQQLGASMQKAFFGGAQIDMFSQVTGMTSAEFKKAFAEDANAVFIQFLEGVKKVSSTGGNTSAIFKGIGLDGARASKAIIDLSNNIDKLKKHQKSAAEQMKLDTKLTGEFDKRVGTTSQQIARLGEVWKNMLAKAMNSGELTEVITSIADSIQNMDGEAITAFGDIITFSIKAISTLVKGLVGIEAVVEAVVVFSYNSIKTALQTIWTMITTTLLLIKNNLETLKSVFENVWSIIADSAKIAFNQVLKSFLKIINGALKAYNWVVKKFGKDGVSLISTEKTDKSIEKAKKSIAKAAKKIKTEIIVSGKMNKSIFGNGIEDIIGNAKSNMDSVVETASSKFNLLKNVMGWGESNKTGEDPLDDNKSKKNIPDKLNTKFNTFGNATDKFKEAVDKFAGEGAMTKGSRNIAERYDALAEKARHQGKNDLADKYQGIADKRRKAQGTTSEKISDPRSDPTAGAGNVNPGGGTVYLKSKERQVQEAMRRETLQSMGFSEKEAGNIESSGEINSPIGSKRSTDKKSRKETAKIDDNVKDVIAEQKSLNKTIADGFKEMKELYADLSDKVDEAIA